MNKSTFIKEITVIDITDNDLEVQVCIFKDNKTNGMFGVDSSYIEQIFGNDEPVIVKEPFGGNDILLDY